MAASLIDDYAPDFVSSLPIIDGIVAAIEGALAVDDLVWVACLAHQLSHLLHKFHWIPYAIHFDDLATDALDALPPSDLLFHRELRLVTYRQAALDHLLLGHLDASAEKFAVALGLLNSEISPKFRAALEWDASVLHQWRDKPEEGLALALRALEYYLTCDRPNELCRLRLHIADLAMDILAKESPQGMCNPTVQSQPYLDLTRAHLAQAVPDPSGGFAPEIEITYILAYARLSRLESRPEDRFELIDCAMQQATALRERAAQGQVSTALADEFSAMGNFALARQHYREAILLLADSLAPGLALLPLRKLRRLEESLSHGSTRPSSKL